MKLPASTAALARSASASFGRSNWSSSLAVQMGQPGGKGRAAGRGEQRLDGPVFARPEGLDLGFALADQAQRDGLHPAGASGCRGACATAPATG